MTTLTDFLLARIAEDEDEARTLLPIYDGLVAGLKSPMITQLALAPHFARHDPARVLAECDAKRRIIERWVHQAEIHLQVDLEQTHGWWTLCLLALPYADHPHYRPEWRP